MQILWFMTHDTYCMASLQYWSCLLIHLSVLVQGC